LEIQRIAKAAYDGRQREIRRRWWRGRWPRVAAASAGGQEKGQGNEGADRAQAAAGH
jgi:hypothetical protein